jgi:hypothetical protein
VLYVDIVPFINGIHKIINTTNTFNNVLHVDDITHDMDFTPEMMSNLEEFDSG